MTSEQYDKMIHEELEHLWILNMSTHFRDEWNTEKFFVTYRQTPSQWRRVTINLDYRNAPDGSIEADLLQGKSQRDKSARIYEAVRESLRHGDIVFYETATKLRIETSDESRNISTEEDTNVSTFET